MKRLQYIPQDIHLLPNDPGVYRFYDAEKKLIYVGKAKHLKKRVSSYFQKDHFLDKKTRQMVLRVNKIECTLVNNENEAFLLENNLIKQYQPRYNIQLKDSKTYPYICVTKERFPRVIATRQINLKKGVYYGPFTNVKEMEKVLDLIKSLYTLRTCKYVLSKENIEKRKFKVCLDYHLKTCQAPCVGLQQESSYNKDIAAIQSLLKGNFQLVKKDLKQKMKSAAKNLAFEQAHAFKAKIDLLESYSAKSLITNPKLGHLDVIALLKGTDNIVYISYLIINHGVILGAQAIEVRKKLQETSEEILSLALHHLREKFNSQAKVVLSNFDFTYNNGEIKITVPQKGSKKELLDLALKNAFFYHKEQLLNKDKRQERAPESLIILKNDLRLKDIPYVIECFDNSNIQGSVPVAAMVSFKQGKPYKKEYRHFHIKTVEGPDDYASMREVIWRRYRRLIDQSLRLPQLIVIDGGKGQLNAAVNTLKKLSIYGKVAIISIAKKLEEVYYPEDPIPLYLKKNSSSLKLLQQIRNEAHRFAISFHRNKRSKLQIKSELDDIAGIGPKTIHALLKEFESVNGVRQASVLELEKVIGKSKAILLAQHWAQKPPG